MKQKLQKVLNFLHELRAESLHKLHKTRREAMETVTEAMKELDALQKKQETIADIAYMAGVDRYYTGDSRADMQHFIALADKFEEEYKDVEWNDENNEWDAPDYITSVEDFYKENLKVVPKMVFDYPEGAKYEWDNIEIAPCIIHDGGVERIDEDDDETPDFWTVYLHTCKDGTMAVADLPTEKEANDVAELIHNAVVTFKDNGYMALYRNGEAHRRFNLFIDERIKMATSPQSMAAYEVVKEQFNNLIKA